MAGPFEALAAKLLEKKAPNHVTTALLSAVAGAAGGHAGSELAARIGKRVAPDVDASLHNNFGMTTAKEQLQALGEMQEALSLKEWQKSEQNMRTESVLPELVNAEKARRHLDSQAQHEGTKRAVGGAVGGTLGMLAVPEIRNALHAKRVKALANKLAVGTGIAGAAGAGGVAAYKHKQAGALGSVLKGIKSVFTHSATEAATHVVAPAAEKAVAREAPSLMRAGGLPKPVEVPSLMQSGGLPGSTPAPVTMHSAPPPVAPPPVAELPKPPAAFNEKAPPSAPPPPVAQPAAPAPPVQEAPKVEQVAGAPYKSMEFSASVSDELRPASEQLEKHIGPLFQSMGFGSETMAFARKNWPAIVAIAAPLIGHFGEQVALKRAIMQATEKAVPYAAGGLAAGAGLAVMGNGNHK